ncbi:MAG: DUF4956 domain-containing protein [Deltaproteobacteria bacterium]|nr:DUF4956 domain-containing protein [Deltaproteobacteria bacterium]
MERFGDLTGTFTVLDVAVVFLLAFGLSLAVGWVYRATHRGVSYSQSFVQTLVILGVVVAFIMLVIGSNIARAFTLVGALSIIRFRNAIKETRDVGFVFLVMAVGMACGTRFYLLAVFMTLFLSAAIVGMFRLNLFAKEIRERILLVRLPASVSLEEVFADLFHRRLEEFALISVETAREPDLQEAVYSVVLRRRVDPAAFLEEVRKLNGGHKASLVLGQQEIDL